MGDTTFTVSAFGTVEFVDLDDPAPPANPVGNFVIEANTTDTLQMNTTGSIPFILNTQNVSSGGTHTYVLADDSLSPAPTTLVEHYTVNFTPSTGPGIPEMGANLVTNSLPGAGIAVQGNFSGIVGVTVGGPTTFLSQGDNNTLTLPNGSTLDYSFNTQSVDITITTPLAALPSAATNPPSGVLWPVTIGSIVGDPAMSNPGGSDMTSVSTHYDARFV